MVESEQVQDFSSTPASSVKLPSLGGGPQLLTYGVRVMQMASRNPVQTGGGSGLQGMTMFSGNTALNRRWGRSQLQLAYNGSEGVVAGGGFDTQLVSTHQATFSTSVVQGRWFLTLVEAASYAPQSAFGLGSLGGLGSNPQGFASNLRTGLYPNESVLTSGKRIDASTVAEVGYQLSSRDSLRASGSFGILNFQGSTLSDSQFNGSQFSDSRQYNAGLGYDRALSRLSNISVNYRFFRTTANLLGGAQTHAGLLGYTRQLTPRLGVQVSGGPELQVVSAAGSSKVLRWTASSGLAYEMQKSSLSLTYSSGMAGGAGVYGASRTQIVQGALSRNLSRSWAATMSGGYSQNSGLDAVSTLRSQYGSFMLGRQQQGVGLSFSYQFQHQSLGANCAGLACSAFSGWSHTFGMGLDWIFRPVRIG